MYKSLSRSMVVDREHKASKGSRLSGKTAMQVAQICFGMVVTPNPRGQILATLAKNYTIYRISMLFLLNLRAGFRTVAELRCIFGALFCGVAHHLFRR